MKNISEFIVENVCEQINEGIEDLPKVETLKDGLYEGKLNGYCFYYGENKYKSPIGILSMFPSPFNLEIKEGKVVKAGQPNKMFNYNYEES